MPFKLFCAHFAMSLATLAVQASPSTTGSLFTPESFRSFTADTRMRSAGELLTVMVYETTSAQSSADTSAGRDASVGVNLQGPAKTWSAGVQSNNYIEGGGRTQRENRVLAQLTVTIRDVLPSGELLISGEQSLEINDERQTIALEGVVRPQDVSESNVVFSNRVANARIRFNGQGELSGRQRPSWWQQLLTAFGL